ncbi:MAG: DUF697 domain-containing protein [Candidatus Eisenbacteria bacterium]|nr:DUF697 domain-containing protein [Candidatus Eisenbacteria bacterium]
MPALETALRSARDEASLDALSSQVTRALDHLDRIANQRIRQHAAAVFVATGVSQSGRLDAGIVLSAQLRLVNEIARLYYQQPTPRELWHVYANVGAAAFVAGEIQDSEILAVLGAPVSAALSGFVPLHGTGPLVSLLVQSLLDGSANALLTLRVGVLARRACAPWRSRIGMRSLAPRRSRRRAFSAGWSPTAPAGSPPPRATWWSTPWPRAPKPPCAAFPPAAPP